VTGGQRTQRISAALLDRARIVLAHCVRQRTEPPIQQRRIGLMQLTRQKRGGPIMDDLHIAAPCTGLRPAPRIGIMANHNAIHTLLHLVHR